MAAYARGGCGSICPISAIRWLGSQMIAISINSGCREHGARWVVEMQVGCEARRWTTGEQAHLNETVEEC